MLICRRLEGLAGRPAAEIHEQIFGGGLETAYDEGRLSSREFHSAVNRLLGVETEFEEFARMWSDIFTENVEVSRLVRLLKGSGYRVYLLSNTNEMHFEYVLARFPVLGEFEEHILSYRVGCRKPDPGIFREALRRSGQAAEKHVYVDDVEEYARAASALGMVGIHFRSAGQLREQLARSGVRWEGPDASSADCSKG